MMESVMLVSALRLRKYYVRDLLIFGVTRWALSFFVRITLRIKKGLRWPTRAFLLNTQYLEAVIVKCVIADEEHTRHVQLVITCVTFATKVKYEILFFLRSDCFAQLRPIGGVLRYHTAVLLQEAVFGGEACEDVIAHSAERRRSCTRESVHHLNISTNKP